MARKTVSLIILLSFLQLNLSCILTYQRTKAAELVRLPPGRDVQVSRVEKMSGERIEFPKGRPGRLVGDKILGPAATKSQKRIDKADIKKEYTVWGQPTRIVTTDGRIYELVRVLSKTKNDLVILTYDPEGTVIPLSEVRFIWIKRTDYWLSALVIIIPIAAIAAFLVWFGANWSMPMDFGGIGSAFSMPPRY